ncbi:MAG: T9SS type A sorting domain-containing protein [Nonlabens sp.]
MINIKGSTFLGIGFVLLNGLLNAQSLERQSINSGLSVISNGSVTFTSALGQTASSTLTNGTTAFRQGVLQTTSLKYIYSGGSWSPIDPSGVATATDIVIVQDGSTILSGDLNALTIDIDNGASLDLGTNTVNLYGDLTNNGTLSGSSAILNYQGYQGTLAGNAFGLSELISSGSIDLTLDTNVSVYDLVDLNSGNIINQGGRLIFKSGPSRTGMLDEVPSSSSITGNVQVERYYQDVRAFRFTSSPVTTTTTIRTNWQESVNNTGTELAANQNPHPGFGTHITGSIGGSSGFDATDNGTPSLYYFDNVAQSWADQTNTNVETLEAGKPWRLFIRGDRSINLNQTSSLPTPTDTRIRATGILEVGDFSETSFSTTGGSFNFIGNPYQASVDMNDVLNNSSNLNTNNFYVWDPNLQSGMGAYVTVDLPAGTNTSSSQANQYLQPSQASFVRTLNNGSASIDFEEIHKAVGQNTQVYGVSTIQHKLIGQIFKLQNGVFGNYPEDSFGIHFDATYSNAVDQFDAVKPLNVRENIYVRKTTSNLSLEKRDFPTINEEIHIDHMGYSSDEYVYRMILDGLDAYEVFLKDDVDNSLTLLNNGVNDIPFTVAANTASGDLERFSLVFQNQTLSNGGIQSSGDIEIAMYPNPVSSDLLFLEMNLSGVSVLNENLNFKLTNVLGQSIYNGKLDFVNGTAQINGMSNLASGTYILELLDGSDRVYSDKLIKE